MDIMNLLTATDVELLACYYNANKGVDTDDLTEDRVRKWIGSSWGINKEWLVDKVFGGNLILSKPFTSKITSADLEASVAKLVDDSVFLLRVSHTFDHLVCINENRTMVPMNVVSSAFKNTFLSCSAIASGVVDRSDLNALREILLTADLDPSDYIPKNIKAGMKITKALSALAKMYIPDNIALYEQFRTKHSQILNQKDITGNLCLSVHPMDYFTMSDNTYGWTTCMSWRSTDGGSYRSGTLSVMESSYVVVAYLSGSDTMQFNKDLSWNSKKWRELFYVTPEMVVANTQYPYKNAGLELEAFNWIVSLVESAENDCFIDAPVYINADNIEDEVAIDGTSVYFEDYSNGNMYSDFVAHIHPHLTKYTTKWLDKEARGILFDYAQVAHCPYCGFDDIEEGSVCCVVCTPKEDKSVCGMCGTEAIEDEGVHLRSGPVIEELYCEECWNMFFVRCHHTDEVVYQSQAFCVLPPVIKAYSGASLTSAPAYYSDLFFSEFNKLLDLVPVSKETAERIYGESATRCSRIYRLSDSFCVDESVNLEKVRDIILDMPSIREWERSQVDLEIWNA